MSSVQWFQRCIVILGLILVSACNKQSFTNPDQVESFSQIEKFNSKVDLLIMSDDSSSMDKYQARLAKQIPGMLTELNRLGMDYHIGVVSSSPYSGGTGGKLLGNPAVLTPATPDVTTVLQSRVKTMLPGIYDELAFKSVLLALKNDKNGFLREDALLAVLFLSNEDDYSVETAQNVIDYLDQIKKPFPSGAKAWVANFLGILSLEESCYTQGEYKEVGTKYITLVQASQGVSQSLCNSDLTSALTNIRVRVGQLLTDKYLESKPIVDSIAITINGNPMPKDPVNGWTYFEKGNFIRFNGSFVPSATDQVVVKFTPAEAG